MPDLPLPYKSEPFSEEGFERLYAPIRRDPAAAKAIAEAIEADPKRVLEHSFILTPKQQEEIDKASERELRLQAHVLLRELRATEPGDIRLVARPPEEHFRRPQGEHPWSCPCLLPTHGKGPLE